MNSEDKTVGQAAREYSKSFKKGTFFEACLRREAFKKGVKWHASQFKSKDNIPEDEKNGMYEDLPFIYTKAVKEQIQADINKGQSNLLEYLKANKDKCEFRLVIDVSGKGYIHALGQDSETLDFQL